MKTIQNKIFQDLKGEEVKRGEEPFYFHDFLLSCLGTMKPTYENAGDIFKLMQKLSNVDGDFYLEDAEAKLCEESMKQNGQGFGALILGQAKEMI